MELLWIDDQIEVVKTISSSVFEVGWRVSFVDNGEDAIKLIASNLYDAVLLDLSMPPGRWGGLWVLEQLAILEFVCPPVIVVSGEGAQAETIQALRLGAADYVLKENIKQELRSQILATIDRLPSGFRNLIEMGESDRVEFKSTLRFNLHSGNIDKAMELACFKSVVAFLNTGGGTLFIGVMDDGSLLGLDSDKFQNEDKFQLHFWNLFRESIGSEFSGFLRTSIQSIDGVKFFSVECLPATRPVFLKWKLPNENQSREHFFVRAGPQTESLDARQAIEYIKDHFS